ncbi:MAG: valine--tRNA ligase [Patescibacteria group bacterium]|nr:valine--tRNA ligase [Patescibacteria group bacterium]
MELDKAYNHETVEDRIYKMWMDSGYFNPDKLPEADKREPFTISLPPPNVTGVLHMGHAFEDTIQDTVIRYQRMKGKRALWVPGTDHAAIATQAKFEKEHYKKQGKSRHDYSRQDFFEMIQEFALANQKGILSQLHKLGLSLDWSRLAFTLDKDRELAVRTAFKQMYEAGLIYRAHRVVNWDVKGQTTVSDDEIEYEETKTKLYTFRYSQDFPIPISTTRPETKVGDTAVAVHPEDSRYQKFIGREFDLEFCNVPLHIKVIADKEVDPAFGTGALGVTPAHSMIDYEIALRHNLPLKPVINEFGKMTVGGALLEGKKTAEARLAVAGWLKNNNLLEKEEDTTQNLSRAQRTGGVIEPLPKLQWFINVNSKFEIRNSKLKSIKDGEKITLKDVMKRVVQNGQIKIMPERFEKIYFHWIDNLRDWCISRQIIYGHQIPVWYKNAGEATGNRQQEIYCDTNPPKGEGWQQDTDTLDTWFSSGLWTFSTLGWPPSAKASEGKLNDLQIYHPTSVMMPGYEILFFWVARMILMSGFLLGDIPFRQVYLHGIVRDKQGRKFSKSLNNGIDPLEMTGKYGTDALRFALVFGAAPGNDVIFDEQKVKGMKHFGNKLWNISRFVLTNLENSKFEIRNSKLEAKGITDADKDILAKLGAAITNVTKNLDNFQLHEAAQEIYQFVWREFADVYLEASKEQMKDKVLAENTKKLLLHILINSIKLLHPFMPFITEELWQKLHEAKLLSKDSILMVSDWPKEHK